MIETNLICPVCDEGKLTEATFAGEFKHNGRAIRVEGLECYHCENCGADPVFDDQIKRNHLKVADAKRHEEGLLTGLEIRTARERLGLTQSDAAKLFGGGTNAFSKYERGDVLQSKSMDTLIILSLRFPFLVTELRRLAGMSDREWVTLDTPKVFAVSRETLKGETVKSAEVIEFSTWKKVAA